MLDWPDEQISSWPPLVHIEKCFKNKPNWAVQLLRMPTSRKYFVQYRVSDKCTPFVVAQWKHNILLVLLRFHTLGSINTCSSSVRVSYRKVRFIESFDLPNVRSSPSGPWHPGAYCADTERKLRLGIKHRNRIDNGFFIRRYHYRTRLSFNVQHWSILQTRRRLVRSNVLMFRSLFPDPTSG